MHIAVDASANCLDGVGCSNDLAAILAAEESGLGVREAATHGISISVDGETLVGTSSRDDASRLADVDLESVDIQVKFDGFGVERTLSVSTADRVESTLPNCRSASLEAGTILTGFPVLK